jgi:hypothetical protein
MKRITLVVPDGHRLTETEYVEMLNRETDVTVESVVDIPDPDRVQAFRVRIVTDASDVAWTAGYVEGYLWNAGRKKKSISVTEDGPTEVPS